MLKIKKYFMSSVGKKKQRVITKIDIDSLFVVFYIQTVPKWVLFALYFMLRRAAMHARSQLLLPKL